MQILGPYLSSYVLVVTAIDRYQAICFPLSNCSWTPRRSKLMITCAWIISIVCSLPQAFIFSFQKVPETKDVYDCWGTFPQPWGERIYVTWYAISIFFIPLIILTYTHIYICREIWINLNLKRQTGKQETQTVNPNSSNNTNNNNNNSYSSARKCLLVAVNRVYRFGRRNNSTETVEIQVDADNLEIRPLHSVVTYHESVSSSPRVNTFNRLSRAKIKTVKITVVVILCYVICSSPFICVQLWAYWWPNANTSPFWTGMSCYAFTLI
jgi:arginine vasopressin receptor 1A